MKTTLPHHPSLAEFQRQYNAAFRPSNWHTSPVHTLTFSQAVRLYHNRKDGYITAQVHQVNALFFKHETAYYIPKGRKTSGYWLPYDLLVKVELEYPDYGKQWAKIAASCRKHQINLEFAQGIEEHLAGKRDHIPWTQNDWQSGDKPRTTSFADVVGQHTLDDLKALALASPNHYLHREIRGTQRDRSVSLQQDKAGTWHYTSASEYAGYGNGSYYIMFSPTQAVYAEDD